MKNQIKKILRMGIPVPKCMRPLLGGLYRLGVAVTEGLIFLRKFFFVEPILRSVAEVGEKLWADRLPYMRGKGKLVIGNNVRLSGRSCFYFMNVASDGEGLQEDQEGKEANRKKKPLIEIGNNVFIGNGCTFSSANSIVVGDHVLISAGVRIHDNDGHPLNAERRKVGERITDAETKPVIIGDNAWIGAGAVILKGVNIGSNAIVGASAVVTGNVPDNAIVAGNPAVITKASI